MSNRRRPQRRDAHGAPVRTRQEIWIAIGTGVSVLLVTVLLVVWLQNEPVGPPPAVSTSPTTQSKSPTSTSVTGVTTSTAPAASTTSTSKP